VPCAKEPTISLSRQRERLDQAGVVGDELLHLVLVVGEHAIARAPAGHQRGAVAARERAVLGAQALVARYEVAGLQHVAEHRVAQLPRVLGAVEDDSVEAGAAVLGEVEPELLQLSQARAGGDGNHGELDLLRRARDGVVLHRQLRHARVARAPAGLDDELLARRRDPLRDLVAAEAGRAADQAIVGASKIARSQSELSSPCRRAR
jgi:hypothetical protein